MCGPPHPVRTYAAFQLQTMSSSWLRGQRQHRTFRMNYWHRARRDIQKVNGVVQTIPMRSSTFTASRISLIVIFSSKAQHLIWPFWCSQSLFVDSNFSGTRNLVCVTSTRNDPKNSPSTLNTKREKINLQIDSETCSNDCSSSTCRTVHGAKQAKKRVSRKMWTYSAVHI